MKSKAVTGTAGVHYVAYRLSAMGFIVALTREGAPGVDLMAYSPKSGRAVSVQVKTATNAAQKNGCLHWQVSKKNVLELRGRSVFYAFVDMKDCATDTPRPQEAPDVFVVPAEWVADPKHRDVPNRAKAQGSVNTFPKDKEPTSFWFNLYSKGQKEWAERWDLIAGKLGETF